MSKEIANFDEHERACASSSCISEAEERRSVFDRSASVAAQDGSGTPNAGPAESTSADAAIASEASTSRDAEAVSSRVVGWPRIRKNPETGLFENTDRDGFDPDTREYVTDLISKLDAKPAETVRRVIVDRLAHAAGMCRRIEANVDRRGDFTKNGRVRSAVRELSNWHGITRQWIQALGFDPNGQPPTDPIARLREKYKRGNGQ